MNELQHLTTPLSSIMFFIWPPTPQNLAPAVPRLAQLFSFGERDGDNFFRARANPVVLLLP